VLEEVDDECGDRLGADARLLRQAQHERIHAKALVSDIPLLTGRPSRRGAEVLDRGRRGVAGRDRSIMPLPCS
jgi:hypothetical protein